MATNAASPQFIYGSVPKMKASPRISKAESMRPGSPGFTGRGQPRAVLDHGQNLVVCPSCPNHTSRNLPVGTSLISRGSLSSKTSPPCLSSPYPTSSSYPRPRNRPHTKRTSLRSNRGVVRASGSGNGDTNRDSGSRKHTAPNGVKPGGTGPRGVLVEEEEKEGGLGMEGREEEGPVGEGGERRGEGKGEEGYKSYEEYKRSLKAERERSALLAQELRESQSKLRRQQRILDRAINRVPPFGRNLVGSFSRRLGLGGKGAEGFLGGRPEGEPRGEELEKLNVAELRKCFSYTDFWATSGQQYGNGAIFTGNLRGPIEEVRPRLQARLEARAGVPIQAFFLYDELLNQQACVVQPLEEIEARLAANRMTGIQRWPLAAFLCLGTIYTMASLGGVNLDPLDDGNLFEHTVPLTMGLGAVLGVGEIFARTMAARYGVKLSPPYCLPTGALGCLGIATRFESLLPSNKALFDIAAARVVGSWVAALMLAVLAFNMDGGVNGGSNPLYVEPSFFEPNLLLSFIQYVIGPYQDEMGNVLPHAVEGVGIPVNPLAFAGLLGLVITALNLLPAGQLEGGRITQALFGRRRAKSSSFLTITLLGVGGLSGSVLSLIWGFVVLFFRNGQEMPALEEMEPLDRGRRFLGWLLLGGSLLMLLPNSAGTFPSSFFTPPYYLSNTYL